MIDLQGVSDEQLAKNYRSAPDSSFYNNWSTYPNVNPYTGAYGTRTYPSYYSAPRSYNSYPTYSQPYYYGR